MKWSKTRWVSNCLLWAAIPSLWLTYYFLAFDCPWQSQFYSCPGGYSCDIEVIRDCVEPVGGCLNICLYNRDGQQAVCGTISHTPYSLTLGLTIAAGILELLIVFLSCQI